MNDPIFEEKSPRSSASTLIRQTAQSCSASTRSLRSRRSIEPSPGCPSRRARAATITHDYNRDGSTTLFSAPDFKSGLVIGESMPRHRAKGEDPAVLTWPRHRPPKFSSRRLLTIDANDPRLGHVLVGKAHAFAAKTAVFESAKGHGVKAVIRGIIHHHPTRLDAAGGLQR